MFPVGVLAGEGKTTRARLGQAKELKAVMKLSHISERRYFPEEVDAVKVGLSTHWSFC
jgi:hypothetical protein